MNIHIVFHEVKIQIPQSINLIVSCIYNDQKFETPRRIKVDPSSKIGAFLDQEVVIPLNTGSSLRTTGVSSQS